MVITFAKPKRAQSVKDWQSISADGAPPGVYVPNMSKEDMERWKGKVVGQRSKNHQIQIRSTRPGANVVITVNGTMPNEEERKNWQGTVFMHLHTPHQIQMSTNGQMSYPPDVWAECMAAIDEAHKVLALLDNPGTVTSTMRLIRAGTHPLEAVNAHTA